MSHIKRSNPLARTLINECEDGNIDAIQDMIANGADINMIDNHELQVVKVT